MERDYNGEGRIFRDDLPDADEIGRIAGYHRQAAIALDRIDRIGRRPLRARDVERIGPRRGGDEESLR